MAAHLDLATLNAVAPAHSSNEELRHTHSDLLYAVRTRDDRAALVYVLFEHQSTVDRHMPFRFLRYMVRILGAVDPRPPFSGPAPR